MKRLQVERPLNSRTRDHDPPHEQQQEHGDHNGDENGTNNNARLFTKITTIRQASNKDNSDGGRGKGSNNRKPRRSIYIPVDFGVGREIWIHGRKFRIVDADLNTRQWFERSLGRTLKPAEDCPEDGYRAQRAKVSVPKKRCVCFITRGAGGGIGGDEWR